MLRGPINLEFTIQSKIRLNVQVGSDLFGLANFIPHKDGSVFINCPDRFFRASRYLYGVVVMPPGVRRLGEYRLTEENGFVHTPQLPKLTLHPDGYIQASLSTAQDAHQSRRVHMGANLGALGGKTIATLDWKNLESFRPNPTRHAGYHFINVAGEAPIPSRLMAFLKASYDLNDVLPDLEYEFNGVREPMELPLPTNLEQELGDGEFVIFKGTIRNFLTLRMVDESTGNVLSNNNPMFTSVFGLKDNRVGDGRILWYAMNLIHPSDVPAPADDVSGFTFIGAMKNWGEDRLRETGERLMIIGDSSNQLLLVPEGGEC